MTMAKRFAIRWVCGLAAAGALLSSGCGRGAGDVAGTVRFDGKPLHTGYVLFASQTKPGVEVSCVIRPDGSYDVADCPLGPVKIAVKAKVPRGGARDEPGERLALPLRYASAKKADSITSSVRADSGTTWIWRLDCHPVRTTKGEKRGRE